MSPLSDMNKVRSKQDEIWKALSDGTRREILDVLATGPKTTGELVERFDDLCRTNVMKHIGVLVAANLVIIRREGRVRWNHLNPAPIQSVCDRWVRKHVKKMASSMSRLKDHVESNGGNKQLKLKQSAAKKRKASQ
ncbi:MAG: ArsR/SmtB family transcription factor [Mariniblastus sp.]